MAAYYDMICENIDCKHAFELEKASIHDPFPERCPACRRKTLRQDYGNLNQSYNMTNTVGSIADRNKKKLSKELMDKEKAPPPPKTFWEKSEEDRSKVLNETIKDVKAKRKKRRGGSHG